MRYLVITDIHANIEALDVCLADAATRRYDRTLVLGDIVGYGPDPNVVIDRVIGLNPAAIVRGNHDKIALGIQQAEGFNLSARAAAQWTLNALTPEHREWLTKLPQGPTIVDDCVEICHGSPVDEDEYIFDELDARRAIDASTQRLCLYGHTHVALVFRLAGRAIGLVPPPFDVVALDAESKYLINPGSVGQPRDSDPRAAYAIFDVEAQRLEMFRVQYPVEQTQEKMISAGLPEPLVRRLAAGR
ncbi:MAG TPA: metallophosphoesterase family protein [Vicinamibacterales bacterium]|nr:metallophosphoesterase family protein [Vicinamibacterales bacterium]